MKTDKRKPHISVIGAGAVDDVDYAIAYEVGKRIAQKGGVVVCGGLGGVMEGACCGAREAGGVSVAIIPGSDPESANECATVVVATGMGHARNALVVQSGQGVVALPGLSGTLSEVALALKMGKPVVGVAAWSGIDGVEDMPDAASAVERVFELLK